MDSYVLQRSLSDGERSELKAAIGAELEVLLDTAVDDVLSEYCMVRIESLCLRVFRDPHFFPKLPSIVRARRLAVL